jgi:hypothetical protein
MDEAIEGLVKPEMVRFFPKFLQIINFATMNNLASSTKRSKRADVRMHCCVYKPRVVAVPLDVTWSVDPVDAECVNGRCQIVCIFGSKFHEATEVIGFTRGFANQVHMIWRILDDRVVISHAADNLVEQQARAK